MHFTYLHLNHRMLLIPNTSPSNLLYVSRSEQLSLFHYNIPQNVQSRRPLSVADSPVCRTGQRWEYGIARDEMVHVSCQVDAHPKHVSFSWKFNNSAQTTDIPEAHVTNNLTLSTVGLRVCVPVNNKVR